MRDAQWCHTDFARLFFRFIVAASDFSDRLFFNFTMPLELEPPPTLAGTASPFLLATPRMEDEFGVGAINDDALDVDGLAVYETALIPASVVAMLTAAGRLKMGIPLVRLEFTFVIPLPLVDASSDCELIVEVGGRLLSSEMDDEEVEGPADKSSIIPVAFSRFTGTRFRSGTVVAVSFFFANPKTVACCESQSTDLPFFLMLVARSFFP